MRTVAADIRYALRGFRNDPGFLLLAVAALGLGIGAVTTIFSVIQNVLLDPFAYAHADRLMTIQIHDLDSSRGGRGGFTPAEFLDYQQRNHVFEALAGTMNIDVLYRTAEGTEQFDGAEVTPDTFDMLGMQALLGRGLTAQDAKPGAPPVFVMSYKMWVKSFQRDPAILSRTFVLNNEPRMLAGIMPPRFTFNGADLWIAKTPDPADREAKTGMFWLLGRLKAGVTKESAAADLQVLAKQLAPTYKELYPKRFSVKVVPVAEMVVGGFRTMLFILMGAVGMLLLIACANVANMLLARSTAREKEIAIRASMGASRGRLIQQFLTESLLLGLGGALLGCLLAWAGIRILVPNLPERTIPDEAVIRLNPQVLLFTLAIAIATALIFGLAPARQAVRGNLAETLKDTGKGISGGYRRARLRSVLVIAEVMLSFVLLVGAGLLMRSFLALMQVDLGFNSNNILVVRTPFPAGRYKTVQEKRQFFRELLARLEGLPGVTAATETSTLPPYGGWRTDIDIPGKSHSEKWNALGQLVSEHYNSTLGFRLLRGRFLNAAEVNDGRKVAVINQTLARKYFGKEDPLGQRLVFKALQVVPQPPVADPVFEIVGIISDAKNQGLQDPPMPEFFVPYTVTAFGERGILVRTSGDPDLMLNAVRKQIWALDSNVALTFTGSLESYLKRFSYSGPRFGLILLGIFAATGMLLAGIGVYSVLAYSVSRQTHEIGVRVALGAANRHILRMVMSSGLRLIGIGLALGCLVSVALARLITSQIWGVSPYDPVTLAAVTVVLSAAGLAACLIPAQRAIGVDPTVALRYE